MMKRIVMLLPFLAFSLTGCDVVDEALNAEHIRGSGRVVQEKRNVSGFHEVRFAGSGDLNIQQGNQESLTVEAEDNIIGRLRTDVEGGRLVIRTEKGVSITPTEPIRFTLMVRDLSDLELSGSGQIKTGPIRSQDFRVRLPGSGEISFEELSATNLIAEISGSGKIEVPGSVVSQRVHISGSGNYEARRLQSKSAEVSVSGSGDSTVWVQDNLNASISGSGTVDYYGNPTVTRHISGSGGVNNRGDRP